MENKWWHKSVVYQIYPRSFNDSNGDGIGDLNGITEKLGYLKALGVDVIWLSPVYKSPMDDNGYDISDYYDIAPEFGTMADMNRLLAEANKLGIKIVMDLVVNHTSDEHPWFVEAMKGKDNPYRDYYIWKDPKEDGSKPNNWGSFFTRSAWELDEASEQYYLHLFSKKQPDLNWENEALRQEIYKMMRWWLDKGIGGFRMDVINFISKPEGYRDEDDFMNGPRIHEFFQEMHRETLAHYDVMTVGETPCVTPEDGILYTSQSRKELDMVFQFEHMDVDSDGEKWNVLPVDFRKLKRIMRKWQDDLHGEGWNSLFWNNHDQPRTVSRFGNDSTYRVESAKMLATILHMMSGTPYIYQGEEIGMTNVKFEDISDYNDLETHHYYDVAINDQKKSHEEAMAGIYTKGRDNARTPMQWNEQANAGFTSGAPWLKVNDNHKMINAEKAMGESDSVFHHYKALIDLRKNSPYSNVIVYGKHELLTEDDEHIWAYTREYEDKKILVIANHSDQDRCISLDYSVKARVISNYKEEKWDLKALTLNPYEAIVYEVEGKQ